MTVKDIDSMSFDELKNEFIQFRKMIWIIFQNRKNKSRTIRRKM